MLTQTSDTWWRRQLPCGWKDLKQAWACGPWGRKWEGGCRCLKKPLTPGRGRKAGSVFRVQVAIVTIQLDRMSELKDFCLLSVCLRTLMGWMPAMAGGSQSVVKRHLCSFLPEVPCSSRGEWELCLIFLSLYPAQHLLSILPAKYLFAFLPLPLCHSR